MPNILENKSTSDNPGFKGDIIEKIIKYFKLNNDESITYQNLYDVTAKQCLEGNL